MLGLLLLLSCTCCLAVQPWMPRELGRIRVPHAGFVEIFDTETGGKDLYITTFNAALPFFHDPVFFIKNPGNFLSSVDSCLVANGDDLAVGKLIRLLKGGGGSSSGHLLLE